ncbi:MAG TPA: hypothetical protein VJ948_01705 [Acidimicrobiia bacterium]|nr:hypothetical protein [Acidimicrobiia bacterium]
MKLLGSDTLRAIGAVVVAAQFSPVTIWAGNRAEIGFPDGMLLWVLSVAAAGVIAWLVLRKFGLEADGARATAFWGVLGFSMLGLRTEETPGGAVTLLVLLVAFCALVYRLHRLPQFQWFQSWAVLFVALSPATFALHAYVTAADRTDPEAVETVDVEFRNYSDVVLVVFDAHASLDVLEEAFSVDVAAQYAPWREHGAHIAPGMRANYPLTHMSLAGVLNMNYPYGNGATVREGDWDYLLSTISGDNVLVNAFKAQGYRYTIVESGWIGLHCTGVADVCVRGIWPDQGTRLAMDRSLLGAGFQSMLRDPESVGALHSIRWLDSELPDLLSNDDADLVLVHIMLPHPPLRLDDECHYQIEPGLGGTTLASPWFSEEDIDKRVARYLKATICARDVIAGLLEVVDDDGILVAFGDHGPDSHAQLFLSPKDWSLEDLKERFGALFVTNSSCPIDGINSLVNLGRWLVACLAGEQPTYVDDRFFVGVRARRNVGSDPEPLLEVTDILGKSVSRR